MNFKTAVSVYCVLKSSVIFSLQGTSDGRVHPMKSVSSIHKMSPNQKVNTNLRFSLLSLSLLQASTILVHLLSKLLQNWSSTVEIFCFQTAHAFHYNLKSASSPIHSSDQCELKSHFLRMALPFWYRERQCTIEDTKKVYFKKKSPKQSCEWHFNFDTEIWSAQSKYSALSFHHLDLSALSGVFDFSIPYPVWGCAVMVSY